MTVMQTVALSDQCFENLPWWHANLSGNCFSGKIRRIDFIFAQFVADSHLIQ